MLDAIKPLVDNGIVNEETRAAITEAWEIKLAEAKEQVRAELREEFATRYQHDKSVMVEALDKMVTESLATELGEFAHDKRKLAEDRVAFKKMMSESAGKFQNFVVESLAKEIKELRADRKIQQESFQKLEAFVVKALAEEIQEFAKDKQAVVETKVRLVAEAKNKLAELQANFVQRSAKLVKESVAQNLEAELSQLKEDIQTARQNMFGRRLFEAFASEYTMTHLNENQVISKLKSQIQKKDMALAEARKQVLEKARLVEHKNKEIKVISEQTQRTTKLNELMKPLNKEKQAIMVQLLESVQTDKLQSAFEKYLPAVLETKGQMSSAPQKQMIAESRTAVTGDKAAKTAPVSDDDNNVIEIRRLAGLK